MAEKLTGQAGWVVLDVRHAIPADAVAIRDAYIEAWRAGYEGLLAPAILAEQARSREAFDWSHAIGRSQSTVLVVVQGDDIVGVGECDDRPVIPGGFPEVQMLYVRPSAWGSGAAARLLDAMVERMRACGHAEGRLSVVEAQARARRFYEREGWELDAAIAPGSNGFFRLIYYRRDL